MVNDGCGCFMMVIRPLVGGDGESWLMDGFKKWVAIASAWFMDGKTQRVMIVSGRFMDYGWFFVGLLG